MRCGALGAEVPGHRKEQLTQNLFVRLLKTTCFCCSENLKGLGTPWPPLSAPLYTHTLVASTTNEGQKLYYVFSALTYLVSRHTDSFSRHPLEAAARRTPGQIR